jgi:hypothetical protein
MAQRKYKVTGFARFVLFMVFFLPVAYFGLSMAKGEGPKSILNRMKSKIQDIKYINASANSNQDQDLYKQLTQKDEEIQKLREELFKCESSK